MKIKHLILLIATIITAFSCSKISVEPQRPIVVVSIPPQKFFVHKIAGNLVDIIVMIPPGASPHAYEPKPIQMAEFERAKAYFTVGIEFERAWLGRLTKGARKVTIVPTDLGIKKIRLDEGTGPREQAGHEGEGIDPHIWLSPELVKIQTSLITDGLCFLFPEHRIVFRKNDSVFTVEIARLQDSIRGILSGLKPMQPFMVFHPSWGYFAKEFNLEQLAIEVRGNEPSPVELQAILERARESGIHTVFTQPQFSRRMVEVISREMNATVAVADPLAEAWDANLIACARALASGVK
jgi:zinc transport system substrate-binding protein